MSVKEIDRRAMLRLRDDYVRHLEENPDPEVRRLKLCAMAHAMQMALSMPDIHHAIPNAGAFDLLMRSVAHGIQGTGDYEHYVEMNAKRGWQSLTAG